MLGNHRHHEVELSIQPRLLTNLENKLAKDIATRFLVPREISFCRGCPHRASFFAIKTALEQDGRKGFVVGDIGCYGLGIGATGFNQIKVLHCMGSGMGNASSIANKLGNIQVLNMVMLGALSGSGFIELRIDTFEKTIKSIISKRFVEIDLSAFRAGYNSVKTNRSKII